ncbi:MAG: FAD-dependent oxidoreductase [Polyangiaceae bacterium]|nr:FAD-dependent oxidoreductase [Polyangiaceae bacterium]
MAGPPVVVLGAGLTGLSAALSLERAGVEARVLERATRVGGHAVTDEDRGFRFDRTGHLLHLRDPGVRADVLRWIGDDRVSVARRSFVYSHGVYTRYPFQANTHGLPPEVAYECVMGFLDARSRERPPPRDFRDHCLQVFGEGISRHFMLPYNEKLWGVPATEITAAWCQRFVPVPRVEDVIAGAVGLHDRELGYNASFVYPRRGIGALPEAMAREARGVELGRLVTAVDWRARRVRVGAETVPYERLVSTLPLDVLGRALVDPPPEVRAAVERLRCTSLTYLDVAVRGAVLRDLHWVYVPERALPFYRVGCYSNFSPDVAPEGHSSLYVELAARGPADGAAISRALDALVTMGLLASRDDVLFVRARELSHAYVIFDHAYYGALAVIEPFLREQGILSTGRYGGWNYSSMEDALLFGRAAAREVLDAAGAR